MSAAADRLLQRLDGVRQVGDDRWIAKCPSHEDRSPSLSVRDIGDRALVHCFAGCDASEILKAAGLRLGDLFERPLSHRLPPGQSRIPAADLLQLIDREATVVAVIAADFLEKRDIDAATWERLARAAHRIGRARDHAAPAKVRPAV